MTAKKKTKTKAKKSATKKSTRSTSRKTGKAKSSTKKSTGKSKSTTRKSGAKKSTAGKATGKSRRPRVRKPKTLKALDFFNEKLKEAGAEERTNGWKINGWLITLNSRGIYPHNKADDDFKLKFPHSFIVEKGSKPWVANSELTEDTAERLLSTLLANKSARFIRSESRAKAKAKKEKRNRQPKSAFCKGCTFGTHEKSCDHMKTFYDAHGIKACNNEAWWNYNWCYNAVRVYDDPKKIFLGHFNCAKTGERCPFNVESSVVRGEFFLGRFMGRHFTQCDKYEGHRVESNIIKIPEPQEEKPKAKVKRKTSRKK